MQKHSTPHRIPPISDLSKIKEPDLSPEFMLQLTNRRKLFNSMSLIRKPNLREVRKVKEKVEQEIKSLETEFKRVQEIATQLDQQRLQAQQTMLQIQGAYLKLKQLLGEEAPLPVPQEIPVEEPKADVAQGA